MNNRNLYVALAGYTLLGSACAGSAFSSAGESADLGGQTGTYAGGGGSGGQEPNLGGTAIVGGDSSDPGGAPSGGTSTIGIGTTETGGSSTAIQVGGRSSTGGTQTSGGTSSQPSEWSCDRAFFGRENGCDCGCATRDPDCGNAQERKACNRANTLGSCSRATGWGLLAVDLNDNTKCITAPDGWNCAPAYYGDGTCHCGCGVRDADCVDDSAGACQVCGVQGSCSAYDWAPPCEAIAPGQNSVCVAEPVSGWTCSPSHYGSADGCDCGCGIRDPDCTTDGVEECERCSAEGACSHFGGCGLVSERNNSRCRAEVWTCDPGKQQDGICDCGCGVLDGDCLDTTAEGCALCSSAGSCARSCEDVDPNQNHICAPNPAWF